MREKRLTECLEHLVAFVEDKVLDRLFDLEALVADETVDAAGRADHNVRALFLVGQDLLVGLDGRTTVKHGGADVGHVLGEPGKLVPDLVRELTRVAQDDGRDLAVDRLELLQGSQHENGGLTHTRLGLAQHVHAEDGLGDTLLLDWKRAAG